ncbi:arrestin domain-containing protein 4-like [Dysidea avara]|uniref:arrestin domain-containing protein 4-like n=1 Tax=Dysidea avara TaxID=196820 RepID=UPI00333351FF
MVKRKHMNFTLNVDDGGRQSYIPGSSITGTIFLKLSKDMTPINNISVIFQGYASVRFGVPCDGYTRRFTNSTTICSVAQIVWDSHDQHVASGLSAGVYEFPFVFLIPSNMTLPSSYEIKQNNHIQYLLLAGISQSRPSTFNHKTASKAIKITEIVDINTLDLTSPLSATQQKVIRSFFHSSGLISLTVEIQRKGYCLGESITINATAENQSRKRIVALRASLMQKVVTSGTARYKPSLLSSMLTVPGSKHRITVFNQNDYCATSVVGAFSHWNNVLLPIPSQSLQPTTSSCEFVKVSYTLNVTLVLRKKKDISVEIPITIGTVPFRGQLQLAMSHLQSSANSGTPIIVSQTSYCECPRQHRPRPGWTGGVGVACSRGFGGGCR